MFISCPLNGEHVPHFMAIFCTDLENTVAAVFSFPTFQNMHSFEVYWKFCNVLYTVSSSGYFTT